MDADQQRELEDFLRNALRDHGVEGAVRVEELPEVHDAQLRALLDQFGVGEVAAKSVLASMSGRDDLRRGWRIALDRAHRGGWLDEAMMTWVRNGLRRLASEEAEDKTRAFAAEIEAALRLSWIGAVTRVATGKDPTCDFRVGELNFEVYCPQQHGEERRVVQADLAEELKKAIGPVKVAIVLSHPITGSGRKVEDGRVVRDEGKQPLIFPTNKTIDRLLSPKKRAGTQFPPGEANVLWLDLKHGFEFSSVHCLPVRSNVEKETCHIGMNGVWHAFYGGKGDPLFVERTVFEYPVPRGSYPLQRDGWFREVPEASCAIVSVLDGLVRLDNPWAAVPLTSAASELLMTLSEIRPEFSWFDEEARTLEMRVDAERRRIAWVAQRRPEAGPG